MTTRGSEMGRNSWKVAVWIIAILVPDLYFVTLFMIGPIRHGMDGSADQMRVECIIHADNPAVHALCHKHGWDR